jgi:hypothetical protein
MHGNSLRHCFRFKFKKLIRNEFSLVFMKNKERRKNQAKKQGKQITQVVPNETLHIQMYKNAIESLSNTSVDVVEAD